MKSSLTKKSPFNTRVSKLSGLSPLQQEGADDRKKYDFSRETDLSKAIVNLVTPQNALELALEFIPGGVAGGRLTSRALKTKLGQKLVSKFPILGKLTKPISQSTKNKGFDFTGKRDFSGKAKQMQVAKHNININRYGQGDPNILPTPKTHLEALKITENATKDIGKLGKRMDKAGYSIKNLDPKKSVQKIGQADSGQTIYEVTYPGGEKLRFWQSSGRGEKGIKFRQSHNQHLNNPAIGASKDYFGVLPGHMDRSLIPVPKGNKPGTDSWFVKGEGWEQGYGSNVIEDTGIWLKSLKDNKII